MSRSEEVLLIVGHVKHKKCEGSLYMMGQRLAWMQDSKNSFSISHNYADIKVQKISPDSKDKIQLQVLLHDGSANTFHFANPGGREQQKQDREGVKELLQQLLPKFRRKVNSELEEKNRMLKDDPDLFQLYKDLVVSQVITADEFWASRANKSGSSSKNNTQDVGVSAGFLADIKPQTDGCNGLKYNLTADIIESIFRTYPAVKNKHAEYVPDKLSETEFWTKFFQSHYFHRDRINFSNKDMFAECAKTDEDELQKQVAQPLSDPLVDLTFMSDTTLDEGYGSKRQESQLGTNNVVNASLIRRFNQHSCMVMKAGTNSKATHTITSNHMANGGIASTTNGSGGASVSGSCSGQPPPKKAKLLAKIEYSDLQDDKPMEGPALRLSQPDRYLHGPTPFTATSYRTSEDMIHASHAVAQELQGWMPNLSQVLPSNMASGALTELSPRGLLMQGYTHQQLQQMVPTDIQQEVKQMYSALSELLRHFWSCFPVTSQTLEEKVLRMKTTLERFQLAKLNPLKDKLRDYNYSVNMVGHMEELLTTAFNKFTTWQMKKLSRR